MYGRTFLSVCLATSIICFSPAYSASLTFVEKTRLIFNASGSSVGFPIKNDTLQRYLVKAAVRSEDNHSPGTVSPHFLVLPEVLVLEAGKHQMLRVVRVSGNFPNDRESVFFLNGHFVPEVNKTTSKDSAMNLAVSLNVKMFYRPQSIIDDHAIKKVATSLDFDAGENRLTVRNTSPYYVTFGMLSVNGVKINPHQLKKMVAPFATTDYEITLPKGSSKTIRWALIDEYGNWTKELVLNAE